MEGIGEERWGLHGGGGGGTEGGRGEGKDRAFDERATDEPS